MVKITDPGIFGELNEKGYHSSQGDQEDADILRREKMTEQLKKDMADRRAVKKDMEKEKIYSKEEVTEIVENQLALKKITIVTGGAGRIGSHLIKALNDQGEEDILLVDDLSDPSKLHNINTLKFQDYADKSKFMELLGFLAENKMVECIYHLGAESSRSCKDGKYLMENNYQYTCNIMDICYMNQIPLVYASSATVYGQSTSFDDASDDYTPESYYALSKLQTDRYSRKFMENKDNTIIGLRYFNVSPLLWMIEQYDWKGEISLFEGSKEIKRDFVPIEDAVRMTMNAMKAGHSGIFNIGTGKATSFYHMAANVAERDGSSDESCIKYIPMPEDVAEGYQKFTQANMDNALR